MTRRGPKEHTDGGSEPIFDLPELPNGYKWDDASETNERYHRYWYYAVCEGDSDKSLWITRTKNNKKFWIGHYGNDGYKFDDLEAGLQHMLVRARLGLGERYHGG